MTYCHNSRYFPYLTNNKYDMLKIDDTGKFSISCPRDAEFVTNVIINALKRIKRDISRTYTEDTNDAKDAKDAKDTKDAKDAKDAKDTKDGTDKDTIYNNYIITDGTAGVGGNAISFDKYFKKVNAVENNSTRFKYLVNNMKIYESQLTEFYHADYTTIYLKLEQDVVFLDPPWGGPDYKNQNKIKIKLSNIPIETIINNLMNTQQASLVVLKLPLNYDYEYFNKCFPFNEKHTNKNMNIVVVYI